jgi:leader peptidase (prepilin peptidase) / N-methyltransferase
MPLAEGAQLALVMMVSLAFGSFVGAVVLRLPAGVTMWGRSHCPKCRTILAPRDMVLLASYLWLGGRCRQCGVPQGRFYPAVELAALALGVWAWTAATGWLLWASCAFAWTLLALALIDFKHYILPDLLTLPLVVAGLAVAAVAAQSAAILDNVAGAATGYALFALVAWAYRKGRGREGLGGGDAKLLAAIGAWVGASGLASVVLIASVMALAVALAARSFRLKGALQDRVPFGPALAAAGWLVWLYGPLTFGLG